MADRSHCTSTSEPVTPCYPVGLEPRETVWGRALRNAIWGDLDPEWTAGDGAAGNVIPFDTPTETENVGGSP
jgi:hypothetical protein